MADADLVEEVLRETRGGAPAAERAQRIADLVRERTGRRWVGIYRVTAEEVRNLAWSGVAAPAHPDFPIGRGLTGAAIRGRSVVVSNDVANDARYLANQASTGSELIAPVLAGGEVVGTLDVEDPSTNAFDERDRAFYERLAAALVDLFR